LGENLTLRNDELGWVPFTVLSVELVPYWIILKYLNFSDRLCGLVVRVLGYRSGGPGSIPGTTGKKK
jgi:hypothetical protein